MSEHEQREQPDAAVEHEETIADLDVPEDDAGAVSGGTNFSKLEWSYKKK